MHMFPRHTAVLPRLDAKQDLLLGNTVAPELIHAPRLVVRQET
jgi:hypothetical protein